MPSLDSLPAELIERVISKLDKADALSLATVQRRFVDAARRAIVRCITWPTRDEDQHSMLRFLDQRPELSTAIKELAILDRLFSAGEQAKFSRLLAHCASTLVRFRHVATGRDPDWPIIPALPQLKVVAGSSDALTLGVVPMLLAATRSDLALRFDGSVDAFLALPLQASSKIIELEHAMNEVAGYHTYVWSARRLGAFANLRTLRNWLVNARNGVDYGELPAGLEDVSMMFEGNEGLRALAAQIDAPHVLPTLRRLSIRLQRDQGARASAELQGYITRIRQAATARHIDFSCSLDDYGAL